MGRWWDSWPRSPVTDWSVPVPTARSQRGCCHARSFLLKAAGFSSPHRASGDALAKLGLEDQRVLLASPSPPFGLGLHAAPPCPSPRGGAGCRGPFPETAPPEEVQHRFKAQSRAQREAAAVPARLGQRAEQPRRISRSSKSPATLGVLTPLRSLLPRNSRRAPSRGRSQGDIPLRRPDRFPDFQIL